MVLREKPVGLATSDCPPRPIALASLAAHRRRVRSFNTGDKATNFSRRTASMLGCCMVQKYSGFRIVRLIYGHSLSTPQEGRMSHRNITPRDRGNHLFLW